MTEKLQQFITERIKELPKESQAAMSTVNWAALTDTIGKKYLLDETEVSYLQVETLFVLTGQESADTYTQNIENEVGLSKKEAERISEEVFEKIFNPIVDVIQNNIKKNLNGKKTTPVQNLDFILSGGDYTAFIEDSGNNTAQTTDKLIGSSNILETKNKLLN
jgi:hypothetical protein